MATIYDDVKAMQDISKQDTEDMTPIKQRENTNKLGKLVSKVAIYVRKGLAKCEIDDKVLALLAGHPTTMGQVFAKAGRHNFIGTDWYMSKDLLERIEERFPRLKETEIWTEEKDKGKDRDVGWQDLLASMCLYFMLWKNSEDGIESVASHSFAELMIDAEKDNVKQNVMRGMFGFDVVERAKAVNTSTRVRDCDNLRRAVENFKERYCPPELPRETLQRAKRAGREMDSARENMSTDWLLMYIRYKLTKEYIDGYQALTKETLKEFEQMISIKEINFGDSVVKSVKNTQESQAAAAAEEAAEASGFRF